MLTSLDVHLPVGGPPEQHFHESDWDESESERDEDASIHGSDLDETGYCVSKVRGNAAYVPGGP